MTAQLQAASAKMQGVRHDFAIVRPLCGTRPERRAREVLEEVLAWLGHKGEAFEAGLAVSELVSNARLHAPPPCELHVYPSVSGVKIAVVDGGDDYVELAHRLAQTQAGRATRGESGRGLQLVAGLFPGRWGVGPATTCTGLSPAKQIWINLPGEGQPREGQSDGAPS